MRDDFDEKSKLMLARRVGYRCSNPNCRKLTSGPQEDSAKAINIGVAAHIAAASQGGKRYDISMTSEERKSIDNGIWLCQNCAKLIDSDERRYSVELINKWKKMSEDAALLEVETSTSTFLPATSQNEDTELLRFYSQCFDRPVFQDVFHQEGSMEEFDRAIEDTITAINTGSLRARDGSVLAQSKGKSYLSNRQWRERMDTVVDLLRAIRSRYKLAVQIGEIHLSSVYQGRQSYHMRNPQVAKWMDGTRSEIIRLFSELCEEAGIPTLQFPR